MSKLISSDSHTETEEAINRWFSFVEEYHKNNTIPLSQVLCPNAYAKSGVDASWNLRKSELIKCGILPGYKDDPSAGPFEPSEKAKKALENLS